MSGELSDVDAEIQKRLDELRDIGTVSDYYTTWHGSPDDKTTVLKVEFEVELENDI